MNHDLLTILYLGTIIVALTLVFISVWSPRRVWVKSAAFFVACAFIPLGFTSMSELLSRPKPVSLEWWQGSADEATILSSRIVEGTGIFLWLQLPDIEDPRSYQIPWDQDLAVQLQKAMEKAEENQTEARIRTPFEPSLDLDKPKFYARPQPKLPEKGGQDEGPMNYDHPELGQDA